MEISFEFEACVLQRWVAPSTQIDEVSIEMFRCGGNFFEIRFDRNVPDIVPGIIRNPLQTPVGDQCTVVVAESIVIVAVIMVVVIVGVIGVVVIVVVLVVVDVEMINECSSKVLPHVTDVGIHIGSGYTLIFDGTAVVCIVHL